MRIVSNSGCTEILGPDGAIAKRLANYESRKEQLDMAEAVADAIDRRHHLAVEAGTGVGKSFAYLVPSILHSVQALPESSDADEPEKKQIPRVVISTHTISLQEQLIEKDIPFLRASTPLEFSAVLVKGRSNYLCLRRLRRLLEKGQTLTGEASDFELPRILDWSKKTTDGTISDLDPKPNSELWEEIACEQGNCLGKKCGYHSNCFYIKARRRVFTAQILVVNHALLFSDLAIRADGGSILPPYNVLVVDEAHTMEGVASDHLGISQHQGSIEYLLNRFYNDRTNRGLFVSEGFQKECVHVVKCRHAAEEYFNNLFDWHNKRGFGFNGRVMEPKIVENKLSEAMKQLSEEILTVMPRIKNIDSRQEFTSAFSRLESLKKTLDSWHNQTEIDSVYWLERQQLKRYERIKVCSAPINVGPLLKANLFNKVNTVIMTSATLSTGKSPGGGAFAYFQSRIGLEQLPAMLLGSPFDYKKQATLILVKGQLPPDAPEHEFLPQMCELLKRYLSETDGGAFVLFTNYNQMRKIAERLGNWLLTKDMRLFSQAEGQSRSRMLEQFKETPRAVLFGTDSFWQGVDVQGDALRNVIITKLPFQVPDQPLISARMDAIKKDGGNPFRDFQLPQAILKLKQGFGRLIRSKSDTGNVVILDSRILTQKYGQQFLDALPPCNRRIDSSL